MISDFLLSWRWLNLFHLQLHKQKALITSSISEKAAEIFEYSQENGYWNRAKVVNQIWKKTLPVVQALYPGY